jgi:hypothetical protein
MMKHDGTNLDHDVNTEIPPGPDIPHLFEGARDAAATGTPLGFSPGAVKSTPLNLDEHQDALAALLPKPGWHLASITDARLVGNETPTSEVRLDLTFTTESGHEAKFFQSLRLDGELTAKAAAIAEGRTDIAISGSERMKVAGVQAARKALAVLTACREQSAGLPDLPQPTTMEELEPWCTGITARVHIKLAEDNMGVRQSRVTRFVADTRGVDLLS